MSITDELRACARTFLGVWVDSASQTITFTTSNVPPTVDSIRMDSRLLAIADSIDEEHRKAIASVMNDALYHANDKDMAEHGWVRGPLDKDGKMWRSGDMSDSNWGEIEGIVYENGKWFISGHDTSAPWIPADSIGHYKPPTVEDVLREMADRCYADEDEPRDRDAIVAEYAKRLRLAGDAE